MVAGGGDLPSYINPDDLVEITEAVAQHRDQTRRVLSTGCEDIASSYFATQYGTSQQQSQQQSKVCSKSNSKSNSRRNSFSAKTHCNNNLVASTMASAAAKIAKLKQQEREEQRQTFKDQQQQQNNQHLQQQQLSQQQIPHQQQMAQEKQINQQQMQQQQMQQQQMQQQQMQQQQLQQQQLQQQQMQQQQKQVPKQRSEDEKKNGAGSRRGSQQFSYLNLLPEDGSYPHRTQPIGEPMTKRTNSTDPSPARELGRRQSFKGSSEYLHATSNTNYAARSNPIGLAEPSMGRDGYGVGKDGSMYRSTGNLNVAGGSSRAGSVTRETNNSWKGERRSSSSDVKGCGIRTGGNMIEPSSKPPPSFNMPFGSGGKSFNYSKKSSRSSKTTTKRERNKSISGSQHSTMDVTLPRPKVRAHSMPRGEVNCEQTSYTLSLPPSTNNSRQASVEPESKRTLTRYGSVEIFDAGYKMVLPNKQNKQSQHASQTKLEELQADHYFFPGKEVENTVEGNKVKPTVDGNLVAPTVQCIGVEIGHSEKSKVGSNCEVKEELSDLTNQISNYTSSNSKGSNISSTNQSFQSIQQSSTEYEEHSSYQETSSSTTTQTFQSSKQSNQQSMQSMQSNQQSIQQSNQQSMQSNQSMQSDKQSTQSMLSNQQSNQSMQSNQQSIQQLNSQQTIEKSGKSRSRNQSGSNGMVVQGNRFNIENGLKRNSRTCSTENVSKTSQNHQTSESTGMMKQLDVALQEYTNQQQKSDQVHYVAKVQSRTTSRRGSMAVTTGEDDVQNITVSLPSSRNQSRTHSRRNSVDMGKRSSRRNSLDIYTAEYAIKLQKEKKDEQNSSNKNISNDRKYTIDTLEQKSAFHVKVANEADSGLNLCGRCHLPTHKTADCTEYADFLCPCCLSWDHWIDTCPVQETDYICTSCNYLGHLEEVHLVSKFSQRRTCVDLLGWEPFQMWFYEPDFRNWWQVTGCCGVPLYKIYPRKTEWRKERKPEPVDSTGRGLSKNDSVDDMIAQVLKQRKTRPPPPNSGDGSSGCSSPDLNHDATIARINNLTADGEDGGQKRKPRTFSQTLNSLDKDILAELDL